MYISTWNAYLADATPVFARPATFSLSFVVFMMAAGFCSFVPTAFPFLPLDFFQAHRIAFIAVGLLGVLDPACGTAVGY